VPAVCAGGALGPADRATVIAALLAGKTVRAGMFFRLPGGIFRHIDLADYAWHLDKGHGRFRKSGFIHQLSDFMKFRLQIEIAIEKRCLKSGSKSDFDTDTDFDLDANPKIQPTG